MIWALICLLATLGAKICIHVVLRVRRSVAVTVGEETHNSQESGESSLTIVKYIVASLLLFFVTVYILSYEFGYVISEPEMSVPFELTASCILDIILLYFVFFDSRLRASLKRKLLAIHPFSQLTLARVSPA